jgi:hypothetical protein
MLTYAALLKKLETLSPAQLKKTVTVHDANNIETHLVDLIEIAGDEVDGDITTDLPRNTPYLMIGLG